MDLRTPYNAGYILTSWGTVSFSRRTQLHVVGWLGSNRRRWSYSCGRHDGMWGSEGIAPLIFNLGTTGALVVNFTSRPLDLLGKGSSSSPPPLAIELGPPGPIWTLWTNINLLPLPGIELRFRARPVLRLVSTSTALPHFYIIHSVQYVELKNWSNTNRCTVIWYVFYLVHSCVMFRPYFLARALTGLLTGHNTLRRHLYLQGLLESPLYWKCGVRQETSAHILCECQTLASLRHAYLGSFLLEPEDINLLAPELFFF